LSFQTVFIAKKKDFRGSLLTKKEKHAELSGNLKFLDLLPPALKKGISGWYQNHFAKGSAHTCTYLLMGLTQGAGVKQRDNIMLWRRYSLFGVGSQRYFCSLLDI
jgi:hypothetical protein